MVLIGGIILLIISTWSWLAMMVGKLLLILIQLLNWLVFKTEALPFSLINEIHLTTLQCWLIMMMIVAIIFMIQYRSVKGLYMAVSIAVIFIFTQYQHFQQRVNQQQYVVYSISGYSAMEWIDGGISYIKADSALLHDEERMRFHIRPNRLQRGVSSISTEIPFSQQLSQHLEVYYWEGNRIVFSQNNEPQLPAGGEIDYLVVGKNSIPPNVMEKLSVRKIILDGSNSRSYVDRCRKRVDKERLHVVLDDGAFILTL
jgi:hypothetical protein